MAKTQEYTTDDNDMFSMEISAHGKQVFRKGNDVVTEQPCTGPMLRILALLSQKTAFEEQLLLAVKRSKPLFAEDGLWACNTLAQNLRAEGYVIKAHGPGTDNQCKKSKRQCLETLSHNYLTCSGFGSNTYKEELIVEPKFREEFEIAHTSKEYTACLTALPCEFVGTAKRLTDIVEIMSKSLAEAFQSHGMSLPPWRRPSAALSKWGVELPSDLVHNTGAITKQDQTDLKDLEGGEAKPAHVGFQIQPRMPARNRKSLENLRSVAKAKSAKRISLLARGLADMERSTFKRRQESQAKTEKPNRTFTWDFSGLSKVRTVPRVGKAR